MDIRRCGRIHLIIILCACLVTAFGCSHSNPPPANPVSQFQQAQGPATGSGPSYGPVAGPSYSPPPAASSPPGVQFFDFQDIPVPCGLSVQSQNSYVFQSGQMKMGFLTLRGRVDSNSVMNFFVAALPHQGWKLKGQFRYNRALLIFDKPDKICVILMKEEVYYTYVEVYVSPVSGS